MRDCFVIINCKSSVCSQVPTIQCSYLTTPPQVHSVTKSHSRGENSKNQSTHVYFLPVQVYTHQLPRTLRPHDLQHDVRARLQAMDPL